MIESNDGLMVIDGTSVPHLRVWSAEDGGGINVCAGFAGELFPASDAARVARLVSEGIAQSTGFPSWGARAEAARDPVRRHVPAIVEMVGRVLGGPGHHITVVATWCADMRAQLDVLLARAAADPESEDAHYAVLKALRARVDILDPTWDLVANRHKVPRDE